MENEKKKLRDRTWFMVVELLVGIMAISGFGLIDILKWFKDCRDTEFEKIKTEAVTLFKNTDNDTIALEKPINLFHKLYKCKPEDNTGYQLLIERAEASIFSKDACIPHYDRVAEKLLEEALKLSKEPAEAKTLLIGIRIIK